MWVLIVVTMNAALPTLQVSQMTEQQCKQMATDVIDLAKGSRDRATTRVACVGPDGTMWPNKQGYPE